MKCPICQSEMRQIRRGATLARRGPCYVCPIDEAEQTTDTEGNIKRAPDALHPWLRAWEEWELETRR